MKVLVGYVVVFIFWWSLLLCLVLMLILVVGIFLMLLVGFWCSWFLWLNLLVVVCWVLWFVGICCLDFFLLLVVELMLMFLGYGLDKVGGSKLMWKVYLLRFYWKGYIFFFELMIVLDILCSFDEIFLCFYVIV